MDWTVIKQLAQEYKSRTGLEIGVTDPDGKILFAAAHCGTVDDSIECCKARRLAVLETARWGEPFFYLCPKGYLVWGVPLMKNAEIIGGLVVDGMDLPEPRPAYPVSQKLREAAWELQSMAEAANVTNASFLQLRKSELQVESRRAEAIHDLKGGGYDSMRAIYLREEAGLISAIKRGDRSEARAILNRVLVGIYFFGRHRRDLLKSFILELVVTMSRSAVEAGGDPSELLGVNYSLVTDLARLEGEEEITAWLVFMLERIMDAIRKHRSFPNTVLLNTAMAYVEDHLSEEVSRDQAAAIACLSPSHFSRVVKETYGKSFTDVLRKMRVDRARELLTASEKTLGEICAECGFNDQSYFTKVFQKQTGCPPGEFRQRTKGTLR